MVRLPIKIEIIPQRLVSMAHHHDFSVVAGYQALVLDWIAKDFSMTTEMAEARHAAIYYGDETSVRSDYHSGTKWACRDKIL